MLFKYQTHNKEGEQRSGTIEALNEDVAIKSLHDRGLTVISVEPEEKKPFWEKRLAIFDVIPMRDVVVLSRQLATLFMADVSALRVFRMLAEETENDLLRGKMIAISGDVKAGSTISSALAKHSSVFSDFYVSMVKVGEESGKLNEIFLALADYLDRTYALTTKIRNALVYPVFVVATFIIVMILMLTVVFPRLAQILLETGQEIPVYTKIVIGISSFLVDYGIFILALLIVGGVWLLRYLRKSVGRMYFDHLKLSVPFFGTLARKLYISRISDSMYTMLTSGVSLVRTLEITAPVVGNAVYEDILKKVAEDIHAGSSVSDAFVKHEEMPGIFVQIVRVGEETGELGTMLQTLSQFYRQEVDGAVDTIVGLIEPALIVLLGLGVGVIMGSVLVPIYSLTAGF